MCAYCSALLVFADNAGRLRMMTEAERNSTLFAPIIQDLLDMVKANARKNAESFTKRNPN